MLRKMYLVSPDYLNTVTSKNTPPPPPQPPDTKAGKKHNSSKRLRSVKKRKTKKKDTPRREHDKWLAKRSAARRGLDYDKWFKVRGKLHEADVERKNQIKTVAEFFKQVLPASPSTANVMRLVRIRRQNMVPRETRTTTSSCNPHKTAAFIIYDADAYSIYV